MKPAPLLRAASVLSSLLAAAHTLGARKGWSPAGETEVLQAMRSQPMDVMGVRRTFFDFYLGFGFTISVYLLLQAVLLWLLAGLARADPVRARPFVAAIFAASLGSTLVACQFIFAVPAVSSAAITVTLAAALWALWRAPSGGTATP